MEAVFMKVLNMSLSASVLIPVVVLARLLLKKAPKWIRGILWTMVAVRLVVPFSLESGVSLIPAAEPIPADIALMSAPAVETGIPAVNRAVNPLILHRFAPEPTASVNPLQIVTYAASVIWIAGMALMLLFLLFSFLRAKRSVRAAIPVEDGIYVSDEVRSPFVLGLIRPRIYLPSDLDGSTRRSVLLHEQAHLLRRDHWWKPLSFLILTVHWFNPLCWLAYVLFCRDIESACDEKVIALMDGDGRAAYSQALLNCSCPRRVVTVCPLAFGETGVKDRVRSVLQYRKPLLRVVIAALSVTAMVAVCFLTNPKAVRETQAAESVPKAASTPAPAVAPEPEAEPSPTPWAGNGHWYTFQPLPWGVMSSTNTKYLALEYPYYVSIAEDAVAIGKMKGVAKETKVYTHDPEERLIYANEPGVFWGAFLRDDVQLTEPDPEAQTLFLQIDETESALSEAAKAELLSLLKAVPTSGQPAPDQDAETDSNMPLAFVISDCGDIPGLRYWFFACIAPYDGRLILATMKEDAQGGYTADLTIDIDPDGALAREFAQLAEQTATAQP